MDTLTRPTSVPDTACGVEFQAEIDAARAQVERAEARLYSVVGSGRLGDWGLTAVQIKQATRLRRECRKARERLDAALSAGAPSAPADLSTLSVVGPLDTATTVHSGEMPAATTTQAAGLAIPLFSH